MSGSSHDTREAIRLERERRHWTPEQWRGFAGNTFGAWVKAAADCQSDADAAVDALLGELDTLRAERDEALSRIALDGSPTGEEYEELEAEAVSLREALRDDQAAWEHDADGWRVLLRHFESLPDVDLWDSKELIAAIQGRLDAIADRQRFNAAALAGSRSATPEGQ